MVISLDQRVTRLKTFISAAVPELNEKPRAAAIKAGNKVFDARKLHPERSLADRYNPLTVDSVLVKAHDSLDREVDKALGAPRKLTTEWQRKELLFANYVRMKMD